LRSDNRVYSQSFRSFWTTATQRSMIFGWITLAVIIFLTFYVWFEVKNTAAREAAERYNLYTNESQAAILKRISAYEQVLKGGRGLFQVSDTVTREEWKTFIKSLEVDKNYPGILGIGYTVLVKKAQKEAHEKRVRAEGFPEYRSLAGIRKRYLHIYHYLPRAL
jgi:CHASE1-domain containing sensor protein